MSYSLVTDWPLRVKTSFRYAVNISYRVPSNEYANLYSGQIIVQRLPCAKLHQRLTTHCMRKFPCACVLFSCAA